MATHAGRTPLARTSLRSKRAAVAMFAIAAVTLLAVRTAGQSQPPTPGRIVAAGPEVDVSNDPGVQSQVSIAIDPTDDRVLVAGSGNWGRKTRAYSSTDGGSTWTASADPPLPAGVPQTCAFGDSTVGIDRLGRQYLRLHRRPSLRLASAAPSGPRAVRRPPCRRHGTLDDSDTPSRRPLRRRRAPSRRGRRQALACRRRLADEPAHQPCLRRLDPLRWRRGDQGSAQPHGRRRAYLVCARARERPAARQRGDHERRGRAGRGRVRRLGRHRRPHDLDCPLDRRRPALRPDAACRERARARARRPATRLARRSRPIPGAV